MPIVALSRRCDARRGIKKSASFEAGLRDGTVDGTRR
jgi:hypothetical protein